MKKIFLTLLANAMLVPVSNSQTLLQQIENAYNVLDSVSYIENIKISFRESRERLQKEMDNTVLELYKFDINMDSIQRQNIMDSIVGKPMFSKTQVEEHMSWLISTIKDKPAHYVLNLRIDSCGQIDEHICLLPDTSSLSFNLFYFDKHIKNNFYIFVGNGAFYSCHAYPTFSRQIGKNAPKVFRKIMRKQPQYLLYCSELEGMNTILYVLNNKIYVYRIIQMQEYELNDYMARHRISLIKKD